MRIRVDGATGRERYELLTSLVVPRPIGWISTYGADGTPNLAPYSFFAALSATPMLVGVSIGHRPAGPKDTLVNVRARGAFCVNVVDETHLEAMNATSRDAPPAVDEFDLADLAAEPAGEVDAPCVASAAAVLECVLHREVDIGAAANTLVVGRVVAVRLAERLTFVDGTRYVRTESLRPVGRLWGAAYQLPGEVRVIPRP
ncbi:MAG: flavin reductase family protein [Gemmatimonadota bacterium]|nr:flavin reductase family protein [Gemmatimonadota bacterium]